MISLRTVARLFSVPLFFFFCVRYTQAGQSAADQQTNTQIQTTDQGHPIGTLQTFTDLVLVDVVVTDKSNPVRGVSRTQFHIFEDGREQTIKSFEEHRAADLSASTEPARHAMSRRTYTNMPVYPDSGVVNVLLLDGLNTPADNQRAARQQMIDYLKTIRRGMPMMIFTLSTNLQLVSEYTTNAAQLVEALQNDKNGGQQSPLTETTDPASLNPMANEVVTSGRTILLLRQFLADNAAYQTDQRMQMTASAMEQLARNLSAIPGRKNLIWFAGSFPLAIDADDSQLEPLRNMRDYSGEVRRVSQSLSSARVAVYPIDIRGILTLHSYDASYRPLPNIAFSRVPLPIAEIDNANSVRQNDSELSGMRRIALATGGKESIRTNGTMDAVTSAIQDGGNYYTIGYAPDPHRHDGKYHKIECRVDGESYSLAFRRGYFADSPNHSSGGDNLVRLAALYGAPPSTQILFYAHLIDSNDPSLAAMNIPEGTAGEWASRLKHPLTRYAAEISLDHRTVKFEDLPDAVRQAQLQFVLVGFDSTGKQINFLDRKITMKFDSGQFQHIASNGMRVRMALDLPPGKNSLRIAVIDELAGHIGSLEIEGVPN